MEDARPQIDQATGTAEARPAGHGEPRLRLTVHDDLRCDRGGEHQGSTRDLTAHSRELERLARNRDGAPCRRTRVGTPFRGHLDRHLVAGLFLGPLQDGHSLHTRGRGNPAVGSGDDAAAGTAAGRHRGTTQPTIARDASGSCCG